jgi:hypothetical protein
LAANESDIRSYFFACLFSSAPECLALGAAVYTTYGKILAKFPIIMLKLE